MVPLAECVFERGPQPTPSDDVEKRTAPYKFLGGQKNIGVRGKVRWCPRMRQWDINVEQSRVGDVEEYLSTNGLSFRASHGVAVRRDEFIQSKEQAFLRACECWNAIDGSNRQRIRLTAKTKCRNIDIPKQLGLVLINDSLSLIHI